ncbi:hypothetical protein GDO78_006902 [Eleutherodactylus coqui]|uniref:Uncharacterized protein n=1 Tax=Eleutherodactylus coqui TaxID=57060 RepID=A0A8J6FFR2_ELECQ|nr:hypothetical protein GDO78_006902 [Eleutherodactylus coqui]
MSWSPQISCFSFCVGSTMESLLREAATTELLIFLLTSPLHRAAECFASFTMLVMTSTKHQVGSLHIRSTALSRHTA